MKLLPIGLTCFVCLLITGCATSETQTRTIPSWGNSAPKLEIDLPGSFSRSSFKGGDFDVFYFTDRQSNSSLSVYLGHHPNLFSTQEQTDPVARTSGNVGRTSTEWLRWQQNGGYRSETVVRGFFASYERISVNQLLLRIRISAPTLQEIERLEAAASTLRIAEQH